MPQLPDLVLPRPMLPHTVATLERFFTAHRLWEAADAGAVLARLAPSCRFAAMGSHAVGDAAFMDRLPKLEIIANFGVGYDTIDAGEAARRGILVTNTPDVLNEEVADTALALLLATVKELPQADRYLRAGQWPQAPYRLTPATLRGRKLGIAGLGRIGKAIARRAEAFGLPIAYWGRKPQEDVPYAYHASLKGLAQAVDTLLLILPGGAETRSIVDAQVLEALGPDGILINVARGSVVDEAALIEALRGGTILAAGLDVFADEPHVPQALIELPNVVLLPHVGSATEHTRRAMGQLVVDNLVSWLEGNGPVTPVAETPWPRT
ncbi:2-hydroxyacid dehydrogenase [Labrys wisconsinensis]|uniref:Lactate dehydrogenase-like 2-hydroxyacid dehydrogenase n=1 Tax=Labrys wisconsinensis TaxID=425677 RepID=A0ABU0JCK5_9HYPH|nr:2-hydroxyacid dehydrogenase [Labrys wisconsinensis]MDQ0471118.1 lactate dehydrogenase-like 2-hydroxyacid dehydrogenase [Labrys wisconsinensis]